jgi:cell division septation protein DedD
MVRKKPSSKENKAKYQIEMSSVSLFFWGFCFCFLLAWVFVLGVLVGRGFLPSALITIADLKTQVSKLQTLVPHGKSPSQEPPKVASDPKLEFFDTLSSKKEEVKKRPVEEKRKPEPPAKPAPERKEPAPPPPGAAEKPPGNDGTAQYTVQLASLEDKAKADGLVRSLKEKGFDAYSYEVKVQGKVFYRIRSGRFKTREEAGNHAKKVAEKAKINGGIVSKFD